MGRPRTRDDTAHLPRGICKRGSRYYLGMVDPKTLRRTQVAAGSTVEEAKAFARSHGISDDAMRQFSPPPGFGRALLTRARTNARNKGLLFTLTYDDLESMLLEAGGACPISGIRFEYSRAEGERFRPWAPSIDRMDASAGYTAANCRVVCAYINLAMNQFGSDVFNAIARRIAGKSRSSVEPPRRIFAEV